MTAEDPNNCLHQPSSGHGDGCVYRIAVFGYQPSRFTLVARYNSSEPMPLSLGMPQEDSVMAGTFRQYAFDITPEVMRMPDGTPSDLQVRRGLFARFVCDALALTRRADRPTNRPPNSPPNNNRCW